MFGELIFIKYCNNLFILQKMLEGKTKESESIVQGSTQLCTAVCLFINVQQYLVSRKNSLSLGLEQ